MIGKIVNFIQYNNFFTLTLMFVFMGASATFAASPNARASIVGETATVRSVDNTYLINTDLSTYDIGLKVVSVKEDDEWYYIDYSYTTVEIVDYVWQEVSKVASMKVTKKELGAKDLGLYVAEQLGQVADNKIAFLKETQENEKKNGLTQKVVAVEYSGLVGQFLSTQEKTFEGYVPVKPPIVEREATLSTGENATIVGTALGTTVGTSLLGREQVEALIQEAVTRLLALGNGQATSTPSVSVVPTIPSTEPSVPQVLPPTPITENTTTPVVATTTSETSTPTSETQPVAQTPPASTTETLPPPATEGADNQPLQP